MAGMLDSFDTSIFPNQSGTPNLIHTVFISQTVGNCPSMIMKSHLKRDQQQIQTLETTHIKHHFLQTLH